MKDPSSAETQKLRMFPRRDFVRNSALASAGAVATLTIDPAEALAAGIPRERVEAWLAQAATATPEAIAAYTPIALTVAELVTVRAAVGRVIPTDELGPGADDSGVHIYIDQALAGPDAAALPLYQAGVAALDDSTGEGGFAAADADLQDDVLRYFEGGGSDLATPIAATPEVGGVRRGAVEVPETFFATLLEHARQGMFGDPVYGGNGNFVGWDLVNYPGIKLLWLPEEQEIGAVVEPAHVSVEEYGGKGYE